MWQSTFLPRDRITDIFFVSQLLLSVSKLGQHYSKINFCDIRATVFLQSYVIMPGGRLPETENKRIYQISGPKSGRGRFGNLGSGRLRESFWNSVWLRNKRIICKVVAYGRWLLTRSGPYERVDRIPLKAFTQASRSFTGETALVSFCQDKFNQHIYYLSLKSRVSPPLPIKSGWKYRKNGDVIPKFSHIVSN